MTYDQIEKMDKDDLVYAFKRMVEIAEKAAKSAKELEASSADMGPEFCPYSHIGRCEAQYGILKMELESVIHVVTNK
jgi:hypothetical protein